MRRQEHVDHEPPDGVGGGGDDEGPVIRHAFSGEDCRGHEGSDHVAHVLVAGPVVSKDLLSGECCLEGARDSFGQAFCVNGNSLLLY